MLARMQNERLDYKYICNITLKIPSCHGNIFWKIFILYAFEVTKLNFLHGQRPIIIVPIKSHCTCPQTSSFIAAPVAERLRALFHLTALSGAGSSPALATCETSQVLLAGVPGGFSRGPPVFAHLLIGPSHMS